MFTYVMFNWIFSKKKKKNVIEDQVVDKALIMRYQVWSLLADELFFSKAHKGDYGSLQPRCISKNSSVFTYCLLGRKYK